MGRPKQGKSSFIAAIDDNLIIDLEDGYRALSVMKVQARSMRDLQEIKSAIIAKGKEFRDKGSQNRVNYSNLLPRFLRNRNIPSLAMNA